MKRIWLRLLLASVTGAVALAVLWYSASPWWTLWQVREAVRGGDARRLSSYVDYDEISARHGRDFRLWMRSVLATVSPANPHENARSFRAYAARELVRPDSEIYVAPEDIRPWLASIPIGFAGVGTADEIDYRPYLVRYGLDRFLANWDTVLEEVAA